MEFINEYEEIIHANKMPILFRENRKFKTYNNVLKKRKGINKSN